MKTLLVLIFAVICLSFLTGYDSEDISKEYKNICNKYVPDNGLTRSDYAAIINEYLDFGKKNSDNVYSAISYFNIAQIYESFLEISKAKEYYTKALKEIDEMGSIWKNSEQKVHIYKINEYGGLSAFFLSCIYMSENNTDEVMKMIKFYLIDKYPNTSGINMAPGMLLDNAQCYFNKKGDDSAIKVMPQICNLILENTSGETKHSAYKQSLSVYYQLARDGYVKIKDYEEILIKYISDFGDNCDSKVKKLHEEQINNYKKIKIEPKFKYRSIHSLPSISILDKQKENEEMGEK